MDSFVRVIMVFSSLEADIFLKPTLDKLPNPFLLKDMEKSTSRIIQSIESGEKIIIY